MNQLHLARCLGTVSTPSFRRHHNESLIDSLAHDQNITFTYIRSEPDSSDDGTSQVPAIAHPAGVNCLAIDHTEGRYLLSGGADSTVRLWDLEERETQSHSSDSSIPKIHSPKASLTRGTPSSHTHALTSISIYPFDPTPSTLLTTSYDKTLKVTAITPTSLTPIHSFDLDFIPWTHALSPSPDSSPLIAVGTAHPAIRLLDLRSGLSTHSLSGPNGAINTLAWSPRQSHILASGSADGKVLFFDIRRANAAFASLDQDDAIGVIGEFPSTGLGARSLHLDFSTLAHSGPVTSIQWTPAGDKLVTAGHDQRIRVWDAATGRNDLVHFGPRIRNERQGEIGPLISPVGTHAPGRESLFWPNDDGRGTIFQHHLREGHLLRILRTEGVKLAEVQAAKRNRGGGRAGTSNVARLTSGGRINTMLWRVNALAGNAIEMYTAHGDGRICAWVPTSKGSEDEKDDGAGAETSEPTPQVATTATDAPLDDSEIRRKRKRELIGDLVEGLTRRPMPFS
ncbi:DNA excision repair protein ERCC-8 [Exophiala viscosa]|uniref:DNA excision repair protein ERCC-8 n=1 Tax=Exophiala viscosa TaxID=2486360 RepID=UPI0021A1FA5B|nr:DNA excision repair protein ERCC-8 [Exophiala viscosa]